MNESATKVSLSEMRHKREKIEQKTINAAATKNETRCVL